MTPADLAKIDPLMSSLLHYKATGHPPAERPEPLERRLLRRLLRQYGTWLRQMPDTALMLIALRARHKFALKAEGVRQAHRCKHADGTVSAILWTDDGIVHLSDVGVSDLACIGMDMGEGWVLEEVE